MKYSIFLLSLLCSPIVPSREWKVDCNMALKQATNQQKPLLWVFPGSDWHTTCLKFDKEMRQSETFWSYANDNYLRYETDFPRKNANKLSYDITDQNKKLADANNSKGYSPSVVVLNVQERILGETGNKRLSPDLYLSLLNSSLK